MRIQSLELLTDRLLELREFYCETLGFGVLESTTQILQLRAGESELSFRKSDGFCGQYHFAFNIGRPMVPSAERFLTSRGIPLIRDSNDTAFFRFDFWDADAVYFNDPSGNIAEFIGRDESVGSDFSADSIQNIGEIGIACKDPVKLATTLSENFGLEGYRKTSPEFFPLGTATGLFIIVPAGRIWFPDTGIQAEELPVKAKIANSSGRIHEIEFPWM